MKAFCFPGQGPQDSALISELLNLPEYKNYAQQILKSTNLDLSELLNLSETEQEKAVQKNEIASTLTVIYALIDLEKLQTLTKPDYLTGYSVGQYVALYAAGCFDLETLFTLVWQRCKCMNEANSKNPGRMAAIIGFPEEKLQIICKTHDLEISNYNANGQYTIAGKLPDIEKAIEESREKGAHKSVLINTEGAWHSSFMQDAIVPFEALLNETEFSAPNIPVIDNVTGTLLPNDPALIKSQLVKHMTHAVQWKNGIRTLMNEGVEEFIEVGYGNMLSKFGFFISRDVKFTPSKQALKAMSCAA